MADLVPFLMFQKRDAAEAMEFYTSLLPGDTVLSDQRYGADGPGPEGTIVMAEFTVAGQRVRCSDSFVRHQFDFTPSASLFVTLDSKEDLERVFAALSDGGGALMPLDDYGFGPFGWVNDRWGVSWQLSAPTPN
ncbi:putative 3-demethylubiquinone-9 3-methyltransferase (glyoxalase superfamily) [Amycolatopsis sulphurea]|uniref:Putative 3-demethylubiquinone-9 3-methyltransferase (Glyoxalase superfamily) n=1 Tax=Amycolatopsis sulphurea TaxID=76022 RepID=A0A2A9FF91_9PSEU|nr:VOC family protein [Amycolatopsis sulphurea]PFG49095.1 putative 3-demethylubiquinone-9 3-methyltransferase (glyoxalase superfamily) [Amycolatopsis sulphurea]